MTMAIALRIVLILLGCYHSCNDVVVTGTKKNV